MGDKTVRVGDLEVAEDYRFQQREWRVQRVTWVVWAVLLAAAAVGLTGDGPAASAAVRRDDLTVRYERITRHRAPGRLVVGLERAPETVEIALDGGWVRGVDVETVVPEPDSVRAGPDRVVYEFSFEPGRTAAVTFTIRPVALGVRHGFVAVGEAPAVRFRQLVLP